MTTEFHAETFQGKTDFVPSFAELHQESLFTRLSREGRQGWTDFRSDPKAYVERLFSPTQHERRRLRVLGWCFGFAVVAFAGLLTLFAVFLGLGGAKAQAALESETPLQVLTMLEPLPPPPVPSKGLGGAGFGSKTPGHGGGGGGTQEKTPASIGRLPQATLQDPIKAADVHQHIEKPELPLTPQIKVDPSLVPPQTLNIPLGDPKGVEGPPSNGPGTNGGIGSGNRGGVGPGNGPGTGLGDDGGTGGDRAGGPRGPGLGTNANTDLRPVILSQSKPKYTEDARAQKIQGRVVLSVEFRQDGTVGDVRIVRSLGYGLDENAITAARLIRFRPAMRDGLPVTTRAKVEFSFNLI